MSLQTFAHFLFRYSSVMGIIDILWIDLSVTNFFHGFSIQLIKNIVLSFYTKIDVPLPS